MLQATRKHVVVEAPNDVWTVDFKGWWTTGDGRRCEPLTVRDAFSRYILALQILLRSDTERVRAVFEELFERHGLPKVIQSDNGAPFAAGRSLAGLTKLSAWWISLGIDVVRSRPSCPQDSGAHERMHADISVELQAQAAQSIRAQQRACDDWRVEVQPRASTRGARDADTVRGVPTEPASAHASTRRRFSRRRRDRKTQRARKVLARRPPSRFRSSSLAGLQIGLERMDAGLIHVWYHHLLVGHLRVGPTVGRNVTVQPLTPPAPSTQGGDTQGDTARQPTS